MYCKIQNSESEDEVLAILLSERKNYLSLKNFIHRETLNTYKFELDTISSDLIVKYYDSLAKKHPKYSKFFNQTSAFILVGDLKGIHHFQDANEIDIEHYENIIKNILKRDYNNVDAWFYWGIMKDIQGYHSQAEAKYKQSLNSGYNERYSFNGLYEYAGSTLSNLNRFDLAAKYYLKAEKELTDTQRKHPSNINRIYIFRNAVLAKAYQQINDYEYEKYENYLKKQYSDYPNYCQKFGVYSRVAAEYGLKYLIDKKDVKSQESFYQFLTLAAESGYNIHFIGNAIKNNDWIKCQIKMNSNQISETINKDKEFKELLQRFNYYKKGEIYNCTDEYDYRMADNCDEKLENNLQQ